MPVNTASVTYTGGTDGTKTYAECSSRGTCLRTGSSRGDCQCDNDFSASDGTGTGVQGGIDNCEYSSGTSVCPGQVKTGLDCSGHGICDTTTVTALYTCTCTEGWTGHDCGLRSCPEGRAFFFRNRQERIPLMVMRSAAIWGYATDLLGSAHATVTLKGRLVIA